MISQSQNLKIKIRQEMKTKLAALTPGEYHSFNFTLEQRFFNLPILQTSQTIMLYYSIGHEVATISIILKLLKEGKKVALPTCIDKINIRAGIVHDLNELRPGVFGIHEPLLSSVEMNPAEIDLLIVPGVAFDRNGMRLGHGAGYYDRFLSKTTGYKLGLAYDFQIIDNLAFESHDVPMDALLTPSIFKKF